MTFIFDFIKALEATFNTVNPNGLLALFALAVITDIGVPVPFVLDTILMLAAYNIFSPLTILSHEWTPVFTIVAMLFVGRQVGSGVLYWLSRVVGKRFLDWLTGHIPSIGPGLEAVKTRLCHWAPLAVVTGRLTPGLLQITSVASGAVRMPYPFFALGVALASIIYDGILILLGFVAAHSPKATDTDFTAWVLITLLVMVCVLWPLLFVLMRKYGKKDSGSFKPLNP